MGHGLKVKVSLFIKDVDAEGNTCATRKHCLNVPVQPTNRVQDLKGGIARAMNDEAIVAEQLDVSIVNELGWPETVWNERGVWDFVFYGIEVEAFFTRAEPSHHVAPPAVSAG